MTAEINQVNTEQPQEKEVITPFEDMGTVYLYSCTVNSHRQNEAELRQMIHTLDFYDSYDIAKTAYIKQLDTGVYSIFRVLIPVSNILNTLSPITDILIDIHHSRISKKDCSIDNQEAILDYADKNGCIAVKNIISTDFNTGSKIYNIIRYKLMTHKDFGEIQFE